MSAALRLVDPEPSSQAFGPSMRPTLVPTFAPPLVASERPTLAPMSATSVRGTEPPSTKRSATVHPRLEAAARHEINNMIAVMRLNAEFLGSLLSTEHPSPVTLYDTLEQLERGIDSLERRFASSAPIFARSR